MKIKNLPAEERPLEKSWSQGVESLSNGELLALLINSGTRDKSALALAEGDSLLICPDLDYANHSPAIGELYTGFLHLEKKYYKACGRHLPFTPVYCSRNRRTVVVGQPLYFPDGAPFSHERDRMAQRIIDEINELGRQSGDIPA